MVVRIFRADLFAQEMLTGSHSVLPDRDNKRAVRETIRGI
jgi:hypothetical protein